MSLAETIIPKSDQLNADDLLTGPIVVRIVGARVTREEQPVIIDVEGRRPWKPCKTMRRVLVAAWGDDETAYVGRWVELYNDPDVTFGTDRTGGIRIGKLSDIPRTMNIPLTVKRGKKKIHTVEPLRPPTRQNGPAPQQQAPVNVLDGFLTACRDRLGLEPADVRAWAAAVGLDIGAMKHAQLVEVFTTLEPGGTRRASFDDFNRAPAGDLTDAERAAIVAAEVESTTPPENI